MINVKDIPAEILAQIQQAFDANADVIELRVRQRMQQQKGQFQAALNTAQQIERLFEKVVREYMRLSEEESKVELNNIPMSEADRVEMQTIGVVLFMACDLIETAILDANDLLHRYDKTLQYDMFNDINQLKKMVKSKLAFFKKNSGYMESASWGDTCDNMYEMLTNKARSLVRKRKESVKQ